jgi:hypothetical protein
MQIDVSTSYEWHIKMCSLMIDRKCIYKVLTIQTLGLTTAVVTKFFLSSYIIHKLHIRLVGNIRMATLLPILPTYYVK